MSKVTAKQKYWSEQLLKADAFEGSLPQYAKAQNIPVQTLYRWRSYFKRSSINETKSKPVFTQVVRAVLQRQILVSDCKSVMLNCILRGYQTHDAYRNLSPRVRRHDAARPRITNGLFVC